jgi:hypothetical protein
MPIAAGRILILRMISEIRDHMLLDISRHILDPVPALGGTLSAKLIRGYSSLTG